MRSPRSPLPAVARLSVGVVAPAMSMPVRRPLVARRERVALGVVARDGGGQRLVGRRRGRRDRDRVDDRAPCCVRRPVSGGPTVQVGPFVSVPLGAPATLEAARRAGALVEAVAGDQAGAGGERRGRGRPGSGRRCGRRSRCATSSTWPWKKPPRLATGAGRCARAERGVLDARRLAAGSAAERERPVERAVEVQPPGAGRRVVDRGGVMPDVAGHGGRAG